MKKLINDIKNILWLCRPYWKYGRIYFIFYIVTSFIFFPVGDIVYVYLPERVVDLLIDGKTLNYMLIFVSIACCISFLTHMFPSFFYPFFQKKQTKINLLINKEIYKKVLLQIINISTILNIMINSHGQSTSIQGKPTQPVIL